MLGKGVFEGAIEDGERHADESESDADSANESVRTLDEPTEHELFEILANRRRRYALRALVESESGTPLGTLAEQVAARENETTVDRVSTDERKRVYTALQQSHLPKMERTGIVRFDKETAHVVPTEYLGKVDGYLDASDGEERPWNRYYLGLTLVTGIVVGACAAGVAPFTALPTLGWFALSVAVLGASALVHTYDTRRVESDGSPLVLD